MKYVLNKSETLMLEVRTVFDYSIGPLYPFILVRHEQRWTIKVEIIYFDFYMPQIIRNLLLKFLGRWHLPRIKLNIDRSFDIENMIEFNLN